MGKRKHRDRDEDVEYYVRKKRKMEKKLARARKGRSRSASVSSNLTDEPVEVIASDEARDVGVAVVDEPQLPQPTLDQVEIDPIEQELSEHIMEILGDAPTSGKNLGPPLNNNIAVRWEFISTNGLEKDPKKKIMEKYLIPENCRLTNAPKLNQEIKAALSEVLTKKDKAIENKQTQIAVISTCIGQALSLMLEKKDLDKKKIQVLSDAGKLVCGLQHTESIIRRNFVTSSIKKDIKEHLYNTKIDDHLFGKDLGEVLKSAKTINKTGAEMKNPGPSRQASGAQGVGHLNLKRPLPPPRRQMGAAARQPMPAAGRQQTYQQRPPHRRAPLAQLQPGNFSARSQTRNQHRR